MTITQERIDALNARLTPADGAAIASDWRAVGDDLRAAMRAMEAAIAQGDPESAPRYLDGAFYEGERRAWLGWLRRRWQRGARHHG